MSWQVIIMFGVAGVLSLAGIGLLAALFGRRTAGQVYVFRMTGVMALAAGVVLGMSAWAMWQWSVAA